MSIISTLYMKKSWLQNCSKPPYWLYFVIAALANECPEVGHHGQRARPPEPHTARVQGQWNSQTRLTVKVTWLLPITVPQEGRPIGQLGAHGQKRKGVHLQESLSLKGAWGPHKLPSSVLIQEEPHKDRTIFVLWGQMVF